MGKEQVILKNITNSTVLRRQVDSRRFIFQQSGTQTNQPLIGPAKTGDDRENRRLAAAGRPANGRDRLVHDKCRLQSESRRVEQFTFEFEKAHYLSGVRSQESGVRSQESGVRSQESGVRSQESGVGSQESGVRGRESGVRGQESGVRSQESGVRSQESGVRSQESGVRSQESGVRSQESGVRSQESGVRS